ncbi:MAG: hypothetical protein QXF40_04570 [Metallosphaera sp.]
MEREEVEAIIRKLEGIYSYKVNLSFSNPHGNIRAEFRPPDKITVFNPIITTPYHEYGHLVYHKLHKKLGIKGTSEQFAQRFSIMWLNLERYNFHCICGSQAFIPARAYKDDLGLICLSCGRKYKLVDRKRLITHHNP